MSNIVQSKLGEAGVVNRRRQLASSTGVLSCWHDGALPCCDVGVMRFCRVVCRSVCARGCVVAVFSHRHRCFHLLLFLRVRVSRELSACPGIVFGHVVAEWSLFSSVQPVDI